MNVQGFSFVNCRTLTPFPVPLEAYSGNQSNFDTMRHPNWQQYNTPALRRYWSSFWYQLFPENDARSKLTWKNRFGLLPNAVNYYSSGEEVLENGDGSGPPNAVGSLFSGWWDGDGTFGAAQLAWYRQESGKGRSDTSLALHPAVLADLQGGWARNGSASWLETDINGEDTRYKTPAELSEVPLESLKQSPFFRPFQITALMDDEDGSDTANSHWHKSKTLAEAIPSMSNAAGSNPIPGFDENNIDVMSLKSAWPQERLNSDRTGNRWLHSDAKDIAFVFNYGLYLSWVTKGELQ